MPVETFQAIKYLPQNVQVETTFRVSSALHGINTVLAPAAAADQLVPQACLVLCGKWKNVGQYRIHV